MSFNEYVAHGWALCGIDAGKKAPTYDNWNEPDHALTEQEAEGVDGAGLMHALSGTCALDIDNLELARAYLAERGIDVDALLKAPEAVRINSGKPNRAKLLYRMKFPMRTIKPKESGIELRCATADGKSVQDVLPPTIHPDTKKPYTWVYGDAMLGHWSNPPPIPANLLAVWRELAAQTPPEATSPQPKVNATVETIRKAIHRYIAKEHKDVTNYEDWLDVGMRLHDQTRGAQEGLEIWDEWSATDESTREDGTPRYQGFVACKAKWLTFGQGAGSKVGMTHLIAQEPAEKEEFDVEPEAESEEETTAALLKQQAEMKRAEAQAELEKRLVFVRNVEKYFDTERHRVILTESGLRHQFTPMMPKRSKGRLDPVELLKESTTKRYVDAIGFHPGQGPIFKSGGDSYANTYRNRLPKPLQPTVEELEKIDWLFGRITDIPYRDWLIQFYAHVVQYPGVKIKSAPLIWSETEGNGKSTLVKAIPALLVGAEYSREVNTGLLASDFNDFLLGAWHVNLTEFRAGSRGEREAITKKTENWIADDTVAMHQKGLAGYTMPNHFFVTASSNFDDAAQVTNNNRKWAVHELRAAQFTDAEREWIYTNFLLTDRAAGVLRHYFLNTPIVDFKPGAAAPVTADRQEMIEASVSSDVELLRTAFDERSGLFARDVVLVPEVTSFVHKNTPARPSGHRIGKILARAPFNGKPARIRVGDSRYHVVIIRNHDRWAGAYGKDIMDHIQGVDEDASIEHEPTDEELLA
jgi:hypothetical protein